MQNNTGFIKTIKTRESKGSPIAKMQQREKQHAWQRTDKRKVYE